MSSETALSPTHPPPTELSGTLNGANLSVPHQLRSVASYMSFSSCESKETISSGDGEEQALEGHKVIELQAFSDRRAWIEEKIKFLEQLPPIEVFVGLDAVRSSATTVPGLPTREELQQWVAEHDRIEKETEIFDSGELKKLKKFTKAATQRNLSPADTDLIEITLTTIYSLDKLLHLLRSRSDSLELLGIRLTWEEFRCGAWVELQKVVVDLENFMKTRARWSPAVYNTSNIEEESTSTPRMPRRDSTVSITSSASESSLGFSRGARFKLAELLSQDAAQYASRVSSLRHSKIVAAGKALDKLIDESRRPVPDELLDEQDHLEDKGINELQDIGKFVISMVMQWKKADEIYVETMKDKADAQTLLEEIETAKLHHPSSRQDAAFLSRTNALTQRLTLRDNPASSSSSFPRPAHFLFPDQESINDEIVQLLSSEYGSALEHVKKVEVYAKQYHASLEAVKRMDVASQAAAELSTKLVSLTERLEKGMETSNGDGTPPDLNTVACLETSRHSVFLALLPSTALELQALERDAEQLIRGARAALLDLDYPGIDAQYKLDSADTIDGLAAQCQASRHVRDTVTDRTATLKKVKSIWAAMGGLFLELADIRDEVADTMERQVWKQDVIQDAAPPTPESPTSTLFPSLLLPATVASQINDLQTRLDQNVSAPFNDVIGVVGADLSDHMKRCTSGLTSVIDSTREMVRVWERVQAQAAAMVAIRDDVHDMQILMENLKVRFDEDIQQVLAGALFGDLMSRREDSLLAELGKVQQTVRTFTDNLLPRVPFVGSSQTTGDVHSLPGKRRFSLSGGFSLEILQKGVLPEVPFDPASLDQSVRSDANSYCMMLSGGLKSLEQKVDHLQLAKTTQAIDIAVTSLVNDIHDVEEAVASLKDSFIQTMEHPVSLEYLTQCANNLDLLVQDRDLEIARSFPPVRILLRGLSTAPGNHNPLAHDILVTSRRKAVKDAELQFNTCRESVKTLKRDITTARQMELTRLEEIARLEDEEKARVARELHEAEERARIERESQEAESRENAERERLQAEEMARIEQEHAEAAEQERLEQERLEAEARDRVERAVIEAQEQEKLEREREDAEVRARAEAERVESERVRLELERMEAEELARQEQQRENVQGTNQIEPELLQQDLTTLAPVLEPSLMPAFDEPQSWPLKAFNGEDGVPFLRPRILEDVFGPRITSSAPSHRTSHETGRLQVRILSLRKRLRSLGINELARPATNSSASLPNHELRIKKEEELTAITVEADSLSVDHSSETGLRSLRVEIEATMELVKRIHQLADFSTSLYRCDDILSDLLEHIDSYPSPPMGSLLASHTSDFNMPPEDQLLARLTFTEEAVDDMISRFNVVADDRRAVLERDRIVQTWDELHAMGSDRINGQKSRPASVISSGRSSRASINSTASRKVAAYSKLSIPSSRGRFLAPPVPSSRRSVSNSSSAHIRVSSKVLASPAVRAVSGPLAQPSPSIRGSTFSSRQRTSSVSSNASSAMTPVKKVLTPGRPRALTSQREITASPAISEMASRSQSRLSISRQSISHSSWARAPRQSFPAIQSPPLSKASSIKKRYVANPKNKLDVAVGEVVNKLPVSINIEVVADTWKDQSGKYWIGDEDPKLCFCRILRSQTVMVRVGGGWSELSKFIKDHFADAFRILPESPSRMGTREERWISSASLSQQSVELNTHPRPPQTPEPKNTFIPSFALLTPSGTSSHSIKSSPGSPPNLNALQFLRRSTSSRPETPSKSSRSAIVKPISPGRQPVWRP